MKYPRIWIAAHGGPEESASHPDAPSDVLRLLGHGVDWVVRELVATHPAAPVDVLEELIKHESLWRYVAMNQQAPPAFLSEAATHTEWLVRKEVAGNPSTPPEVLGTLADDGHVSVRMSVAGNQSTTAEVLVKLSTHNPGVREKVAGNPSTPEEVLRKLARDRFPKVREYTAANPSTPVDALRKLARGGGTHGMIPGAVAMNPSTPDDILRKLLDNEFDSVRKAAAHFLAKRGLA